VSDPGAAEATVPLASVPFSLSTPLLLWPCSCLVGGGGGRACPGIPLAPGPDTPLPTPEELACRPGEGCSRLWLVLYRAWEAALLHIVFVVTELLVTEPPPPDMSW